MTSLFTSLSSLWRGLRHATGDDAYERYLQHWHTDDTHDEEEPLDRKTFHARRLDEDWNQPRRCC